jgi:hypothetical protein
MVPRYLYRTLSPVPSSAPTKIDAAVVENGGQYREIGVIEKVALKDMVEHLLSGEPDPDSQFTLWSCSFLFALTSALYQKENGSGDVAICVLDTRNMDQEPLFREVQPSMFPVTQLLDVLNDGNLPDSDKSKYRAAFLIHGTIRGNGSLSCASLSHLENLGVMSIGRIEEEEWWELGTKGVYAQVEDIRKSLQSPDKEPCKTIPDDAEFQKRIAMAFGPAFALPMMLAMKSSLDTYYPNDLCFLEEARTLAQGRQTSLHSLESLIFHRLGLPTVLPLRPSVFSQG